MPERLVVVAHRREHPLDRDAGGIARHQHHGVAACRSASGSDSPMKTMILHSGLPIPVENHLRPLMTTSSPSIDGGRGHVGRVRGGDVGFGHAERAADPRVEHRLQPLALLVRRPVAQQHLHVAGVGGVAVEHERRERRAAHHLGHGCVVDVGQPLAAIGPEVRGIPAGVLLGQEQVPQSLGAGLGLQLLDHRRRRPRVAAALATAEDLGVQAGLDGFDLGVDERPDAVAQVGGTR